MDAERIQSLLTSYQGVIWSGLVLQGSLFLIYILSGSHVQSFDFSILDYLCHLISAIGLALPTLSFQRKTELSCQNAITTSLN